MTDIALDEKLAPCPFCGGEPKIAGLKPHLYVRCQCCGCEGPVFQTMPAEAIAAWNRRASPSQVAPQPQAGEPVGIAGTMPGTDGFTMACFKAADVPVGTPLYASPQPANPAQVTDAWMVTNGPDGLHSKIVVGFDNLKREVVAAVFGDSDDTSEEAQNMRDRLDAPGDWEGDHWSISWSFEDGYLNVQRISDLSALTAAIGAGGQAVAEPAPRKGFPILSSNGQKIDWQLVADHSEQAQKNHYQSVERLAQRGGLSWCELHAVLHNKPWQKMDENDAITACRALESRYLAALSATEGR